MQKEVKTSITKRINIAHSVLCGNEKEKAIHGHTLNVTMVIKQNVDEYGIVNNHEDTFDYVLSKLDHQYINKVMSDNPTFCNIAEYILDSMKDYGAISVTVSCGEESVEVSLE